MRWLLGAVVVAFAAGWWFSLQYQDSQQLLIERAARKAAVEIQTSIAATAQVVENKLQDLRANERHTEKVIRTEVVKPVFNNVCATDDYMRLFNDATERDESILSGKSIN
ncbi:hypothetical protein [Pragia fontium]|uniref:Uncharacterized protein n=1 Tax=Pragia fontium DSM 5563 = ATCC 49100 TaxID=1122977 RepID=A0AAJ4W9H0_9GAMM|nr:hypothetical protein [Pragia fontium]SFC49862.1 hypothetical protein SAMN02745723_102513 [Pragia fontium DSM 5563 = ATCC 49100]